MVCSAPPAIRGAAVKAGAGLMGRPFRRYKTPCRHIVGSLRPRRQARRALAAAAWQHLGKPGVGKKISLFSQRPDEIYGRGGCSASVADFLGREPREVTHSPYSLSPQPARPECQKEKHRERETALFSLYIHVYPLSAKSVQSSGAWWLWRARGHPSRQQGASSTPCT